MEDVFSGERFMLYSQGTADILKSQRPILWFNPIGYNGACWQSYGPIGPYSGFEPDDIFFYATELNPQIESDEDIVADIDRNPIPYWMLICGANYPLTFNGNDQVLQVAADYDLDHFSTDNLRDDFTIEYN